ncbi:MAG: 6-bladed beta-propeller [bacterium]
MIRSPKIRWRGRVLASVAVVLALPAGSSPTTPEAAVVFPPSPEIARVRYVDSIRDDARFRAPEPWWRKLFGLVAGRRAPFNLVRPYGVDATPEAVWVCDPGAHVVHGFRSDSTYVRIPRDGVFSSPIDVAVDARGNLHVTDSVLGTVTCWSPSGEPLFAHETSFARPTGIAYHAGRDRLYVVDTVAHTIAIHTPDGRSVGAFGARGDGPGDLNFPTAIDVTADGRLLVTDAMNFRVQVFDADGRFEREIGHLGDGPGTFSKPKGVASGPDGHVWVVDAMLDGVQVFDAAGDLLLAFGHEGRGAGEFWLPAGIDVSDAGTVYVADSWNQRIQVFQYLEEVR